MRESSFDFNNLSILDKTIHLLRSSKVKRYIPKDALVLDLGCGYDAPFLISVSDRIRQGEGVDVQINDKLQHKNINLSRGRADERLPYGDNVFDIVTALAVVEHVENPETMILEANRVLKKGGKLILTTPSTYSKPVLEFLAFKLGLISREEIEDHKRYYDPETLSSLVLSANFEVVDTNYFELFMNIFLQATK